MIRSTFQPRNLLLPLALLVGVLVFLFKPSGTGAFIASGDRFVAFVGDSITEDGGYVDLVETFFLARHPDREIRFRNFGIGGDTVGLRRRGGIRETLARDFADNKPDAVTLCFGMNDGREDASGGLEKFQTDLKRLVNGLKDCGVRVGVLSAPPEEGKGASSPGGSDYNFILWKYVEAAEEISRNAGIPFVDLFTPMLRAIEYAQSYVPDLTLVPDGVHPGPEGHLVMAERILASWGEQPIECHAEIDFKSGRVLATKGCRVELKPVPSAGAGLVFDRKDDFLPWGIPDAALNAGKIGGFKPVADWSKVTLVVRNLPEGYYELRIDGATSGSFDEIALDEGINLTTQPGPLRAAALALHEAVALKNGKAHAQYKQVRLFRPPEWLLGKEESGAEADQFRSRIEERRAVELARLDGEIAIAEAAITPLRESPLRRWELVPVSAPVEPPPSASPPVQPSGGTPGSAPGSPSAAAAPVSMPSPVPAR